jgi:hypothetical protein
MDLALRTLAAAIARAVWEAEDDGQADAHPKDERP